MVLIGLDPAPRIAIAAGKSAPAEAPSALPDGLVIPSYTPGTIPLHPGEQLVFRASWLGLPAGEARIVLNGDSKDPRMWDGEIWVRTSPGVDLLYKLRDYLRDRFSRATLATRDISITHHENKRSSEYRLDFDRRARLVTAVKRNKKGTATSRFRADHPSGPFSGAMMALSQPLTVGQKLTFDVFSARTRYVIEFTVAGRERISTPLGDFDALRIATAIPYLSDSDARKTAHETTLWVSADRHLPLRIEATAFVGKLRADLVQIGAPPPATPVPASGPGSQ
jgi:uncharacterized protein DUF3108